MEGDPAITSFSKTTKITQSWPKTHRSARVLMGILYVLRSRIPWEMLQQELGCGSGMSCRRYLRKWQEQGVWQKIHEVLLARPRGANKINFSRAVADSSRSGLYWAGKNGTKHHIITEAQGIPLAIRITEANPHDVTQLLPLVDGIPPIRRNTGQPCGRRIIVQGDCGYDSEPHRCQLRTHSIVRLIRKRGHQHGSALGSYR
jgi:transposase